MVIIMNRPMSVLEISMSKVFFDVGQKIASFLKERVDYGVSDSSPTIEQLNHFFETFSMADLLPYRSYDPHQEIFYNEKGIGFVFEVNPLVGCTEEMQVEISGLFKHTLPEGCNIQFMLWADPRIKGLLDYWSRARTEQGAMFEKLALRRADYIGSLVFNNPSFAPPRNFRCIISVSQQSDMENPLEREKFNTVKDQVKTSLETLGLNVKTFSADDLISTLDGIINFNSSIVPSDLKWNQYDSIHQQIPVHGNSLQVEREHLNINSGESLIRSYSVRREPDFWSLYAMGELIGDQMRDRLQVPCPFMISYGIRISDQEKAERRVQSKESWVEKQSHSKIGKRIPIIKKQARELDFVRHQQGEGERFVETNFTVTIFSPKEEINNSDQLICNLFRSKRWEIKSATYIQLPIFLSTLPMMWGEGLEDDLYTLQRLKTTLSTESANLLPIQGCWKGTPSPGMLLLSRQGQIFMWNEFDNQEGNYNIVVVGKSGSGKSVFMQEKVASTLGCGGRVFVLDVGRSFEKTARLLEGEFLEFSTKSPICINPFSTIPTDDEEEADDALAMLKPIVALMAAPNDGTNDLENSFLEQAIKSAWNSKRQKASITDVSAFLCQQEDAVAKTLGQKLYPYTKDGVYGRFFEGPATVELSNRMVVVELEELKERKDLQAVIVQITILQITNSLYLGDRKTPSNVLLDEAWDMLRGNQSGLFIETAARRLRKYYASLVIGTQSVNDLYATPAAKAAFENSDWICLLSQKKESIKFLKDSGRIVMDPVMEEMLTSVHTKQGLYAEVLIYGPHGYAVGRLILDPYSLILYSTKPEEFAAVQHLVDQGIALADAVEEVSLRKAA